MPLKKEEQYLLELLQAWEKTFTKGLLTFWILSSLKKTSKCLEEISAFMEVHSMGTVSFDEQSIYRGLRKYYELELVDYELRDSPKGPQRKYYGLTPFGTELLILFYNRNIQIYQSTFFTQFIK